MLFYIIIIIIKWGLTKQSKLEESIFIGSICISSRNLQQIFLRNVDFKRLVQYWNTPKPYFSCSSIVGGFIKPHIVLICDWKWVTTDGLMRSNHINFILSERSWSVWSSVVTLFQSWLITSLVKKTESTLYYTILYNDLNNDEGVIDIAISGQSGYDYVIIDIISYSESHYLITLFSTLDYSI